ncbi:MAG TPA: SDR family NAD(P)-dependent oxidoreductase [Woeseiaceae bacterium]|jgi:NAD(P)-dependent dehydrogenase (short-subunit alcohol dehydrogenase family)|nr:SDR family NAD(P)-dependent oxidoreductase [Woeseiaceae bacterium]
MSLISSLTEPARIVVIGASGGIGAAVVERLRGDERAGAVYALSRSPGADEDGVVRPGHIDLIEEGSVRAAAERIAEGGKLDLVFVATGILHRGDALHPEKRVRDVDAGAMAEVLRVNTIGPALVARHFLPLMRRDAKSVFAAISARVGSIGDNRLGGWASYRASKAALNMLIKTFSIEHARTHPDGICVALHPGTVDTALSRPFQARVPEGRLFTPGYSAERMLSVLDGLGPADSGGVYAWDGSRIEY